VHNCPEASRIGIMIYAIVPGNVIVTFNVLRTIGTTVARKGILIIDSDIFYLLPILDRIEQDER
jgi:hypothetical protein